MYQSGRMLPIHETQNGSLELEIMIYLDDILLMSSEKYARRGKGGSQCHIYNEGYGRRPVVLRLKFRP